METLTAVRKADNVFELSHKFDRWLRQVARHSRTRTAATLLNLVADIEEKRAGEAVKEEDLRFFLIEVIDIINKENLIQKTHTDSLCLQEFQDGSCKVAWIPKPEPKPDPEEDEVVFVRVLIGAGKHTCGGSSNFHLSSSNLDTVIRVAKALDEGRSDLSQHHDVGLASIRLDGTEAHEGD